VKPSSGRREAFQRDRKVMCVIVARDAQRYFRATDIFSSGPPCNHRPYTLAVNDLTVRLASLERVKAEADRLFRRAEDAYDRSTLPAGPERVQVEDLCVIWVRETLRERGAI
jgi:hypothetical protein